MRTVVHHLTLDEGRQHRLEAHAKVSPDSHGGCTPAPDRPEPRALTDEQKLRRDFPAQHGRMMLRRSPPTAASSFGFAPSEFTEAIRTFRIEVIQQL